MVFLTASVKFLPTPSCILLTQNNLIPICASGSFFPWKIYFQPPWKGSSTAKRRAEESKAELGTVPSCRCPRSPGVPKLLHLSVPQFLHAQGKRHQPCCEGEHYINRGAVILLSEIRQGSESQTPRKRVEVVTAHPVLHTTLQRNYGRGTGTHSQLFKLAVPFWQS